MRAHVRWTPELDEGLRGLRTSGLTWEAIAVAMGLGRNTVLERARKIGARQKRPAPVRIAAEARDRPAMVAGHPATWALMTADTVLEGCAYPYPVFL